MPSEEQTILFRGIVYKSIEESYAAANGPQAGGAELEGYVLP